MVTPLGSPEFESALLNPWINRSRASSRKKDQYCPLCVFFFKFIMKYDHIVSRHVASHPRTRTHHKARALPWEQPQGHTSHTHPINSVCPPALLPQKDALWWRKRGARGGGGGGGFKSNKRGQIEHLSKITPSPQRLTIKQCFSQLFLYPFIKHWTCLNLWEIVVYIFFHLVPYLDSASRCQSSVGITMICCCGDILWGRWRPIQGIIF